MRIFRGYGVCVPCIGLLYVVFALLLATVRDSRYHFVKLCLLPQLHIGFATFNERPLVRASL